MLWFSTLGFIRILYHMYIVTEAITRLSLHQWMVIELCECIKNYDIKWRSHCKATQYHVHPWDPWDHKRRQLQATNLSMLSSLISMSTAVFNGVTSFLYSDHGTQLHIALRVLLWNVINMIKVPSFCKSPAPCNCINLCGRTMMSSSWHGNDFRIASHLWVDQ